MANSSKNKSSTPARRSSTGRTSAPRGSGSGSGSRNTSRDGGKLHANKANNTAKRDDPTLADYWHAFSKTRIFRPFMAIVIFGVVILLNLLIAWNNYDRFFMFTGIEMLILAAVWLFGMLYSMSIQPTPESSREE